MLQDSKLPSKNRRFHVLLLVVLQTTSIFFTCNCIVLSELLSREHFLFWFCEKLCILLTVLFPNKVVVYRLETTPKDSSVSKWFLVRYRKTTFQVNQIQTWATFVKVSCQDSDPISFFRLVSTAEVRARWQNYVQHRII